MTLRQAIARELAEIHAGTREDWSARLIYRARYEVGGLSYAVGVAEQVFGRRHGSGYQNGIRLMLELYSRCQALRRALVCGTPQIEPFPSEFRG